MKETHISKYFQYQSPDHHHDAHLHHHHCQHHHQHHHQHVHIIISAPDTGRKKFCSVNEDDPKASRDCVLCNIDQAILGSLVLHNQLLQLPWQRWMRFYRNMKRKHDTRNWEKYNLRNIKTSMKADTMSATPVNVREREKTGFLPQRSINNI